MPGEMLDRANPQPLNSHIDESIRSLSVKLDKLNLSDDDLKALREFRRASNYIAAGKSNQSLPLYSVMIRPSSSLEKDEKILRRTSISLQALTLSSYDLSQWQCSCGKRYHL